MRKLLVTVVALAALGLTSACASTGAAPGTRRNMDELTREEIQGSDYANAYDIIRNMRPRWLRVRGPTSFAGSNPIMVYVDGSRLGTLDELSAIPKLSIDHMKYHSPTEAQARWGLNHTNGAIEVVTRRN